MSRYANQQAMRATHLERHFSGDHQLMIGEELIKIVVRKAVEIIARSKSEIMKLRQDIYQACNGIEACEIEFKPSVLKKLMVKAEFGLKRFCNSRLMCHASHGVPVHRLFAFHP